VALMKIRTNQLMHSKQESSQPWSKGHSLGGQGQGPQVRSPKANDT